MPYPCGKETGSSCNVAHSAAVKCTPCHYEIKKIRCSRSWRTNIKLRFFFAILNFLLDASFFFATSAFNKYFPSQYSLVLSHQQCLPNVRDHSDSASCTGGDTISTSAAVNNTVLSWNSRSQIQLCIVSLLYPLFCVFSYTTSAHE